MEFKKTLAVKLNTYEQMNIKGLEKKMKDKKKGIIGSINVLENFLKDNLKDFNPLIIENFRDIMSMRSKKFPIHKTESKFLEVVIKIIGKYPPNWSELYSKSLDNYKNSLNELLSSLQKGDN